MRSTAERPATSGAPLPPASSRRLFVAWQDPDNRAITPVACVQLVSDDNSDVYEFRYLRRVIGLPRFRPFVGSPDLRGVYRSSELFPFFENRLMPRRREDYGDYLASLALSIDADPFEILARSGGRRATDTIEVFPEPVVDPASRTATCRFLARGIRHLPGAQSAIDDLRVGERLGVLQDPQNEHDLLALLLRSDDYRLVGYVPAFLTSVVHRAAEARGWTDVTVIAEHIGNRGGPVHLRLLCQLAVPWPFEDTPFSGPEFELLVPK